MLQRKAIGRDEATAILLVAEVATPVLSRCRGPSSMRKLFSLPSILPMRLGLPGRSAVAAGLSQRLGGVATSEADKLLAEMGSELGGLSQEEAERRLEQSGPNAVAQEERNTARALLTKALRKPLVVLLSLLAAVLALTGELHAAIVMLAIVVLGSSPWAGALSFVALPRLYWVFLFLTLTCYMALTQVVKSRLLKKAWA